MDKKLLDEIRTIAQQDTDNDFSVAVKGFLDKLAESRRVRSIPTKYVTEGEIREFNEYINKCKKDIENKYKEVKDIEDRIGIKIGNSEIFLDYNLFLDEGLEKGFFEELQKNFNKTKKEYLETFLTLSEEEEYLKSCDMGYLLKLKKKEYMNFLQKYSLQRESNKTKRNKEQKDRLFEIIYGKL